MRQLALFLWLILSIFSFSSLATNTTSLDPSATNGLLEAFRAHYAQFQTLVTQVYTEETDPFLLQLLGEDLEEFYRIADQVSIY